MRETIADLIIVGGAGLAIVGVWHISPAAAMIVCGLMFMVSGAMVSRKGKRK